ncbi:ADP-ribosyl cyclase/cyclic ADP-ribose hydrolase 1-like isoform X2 [Notolabrus celidotus]|uniref:ADP-ribosyl cyclase/cyclic ADP-ribose hydrolase 1-like isoform X2 n=1 Tax=Notolabrus celidotus TaxID=1203425 RepID=UPI00148FABF9|nr:ADP-ribosyl cyclase/cyclic ADP-ribose hydrolase 1-like isoform X2 [Notolabrus celidotus]
MSSTNVKFIRGKVGENNTDDECNSMQNGKCKVKNEGPWKTAVGVMAVILVVVVAVCVGLGVHCCKRRVQQDRLKLNFTELFINRCEIYGGKNKRTDWQHVFKIFEQAYVGKSSGHVPMEAYYPLMDLVPFEHPCNTTMLWSKTQDLVYKYTENKKSCFILKDTLLVSVLENQEWCGKEGSNKTITENCPISENWKNNSVNSFWRTASAAQAV